MQAGQAHQHFLLLPKITNDKLYPHTHLYQGAIVFKFSSEYAFQTFKILLQTAIAFTKPASKNDQLYVNKMQPDKMEVPLENGTCMQGKQQQQQQDQQLQQEGWRALVGTSTENLQELIMVRAQARICVDVSRIQKTNHVRVNVLIE